MDTKKYMTMVNKHLRCLSKEIERDKVRDIFEITTELLDEVGFQFLKNEVGHINKSLKNEINSNTKVTDKGS